MEEILSKYKTYCLIEKGFKPCTVSGKYKALKYLLQSSSVYGNIPSLTRENVESFLLSLKEKGCGNTYINDLLAIYRPFVRWCIENGIEADPEILKIKSPKRDLVVKSVMSDEEIEAFLKLPPPTTTHRSRWKKKIITRPVNPAIYHRWSIFFSIMAYSGMRCGEVSKLTADDIDFGRDVFILRDTKTNDNRIVPIAPNILEDLKKYIENLKTKQLFPSNRPEGHTSNVEWHYNFHTRIKRLGIKRQGLTPYSLRHSMITRLLEEDVNIFKVQKLVGHKRIETTASYTHLTTKDVKEAIQKHPLIRKSTNPEYILQKLIETIKKFELEKDSRFKYKIVESQNSLELSAIIS